MTAAAKKDDEPKDARDDEITVERRVRMPPPLPTSPASFPTKQMAKIDSRLLAIARGELEPDDPFGGLIPIYDDDLAGEVEDGWLVMESAPSSGEEAMFGRSVPSVRITLAELVALPMSEEAAFLVSQIDGKRSIEDLRDVCRIGELATLEVIDELLRLGAIELA